MVDADKAVPDLSKNDRKIGCCLIFDQLKFEMLLDFVRILGVLFVCHGLLLYDTRCTCRFFRSRLLSSIFKHFHYSSRLLVDVVCIDLNVFSLIFIEFL